MAPTLCVLAVAQEPLTQLFRLVVCIQQRSHQLFDGLAANQDFVCNGLFECWTCKQMPQQLRPAETTCTRWGMMQKQSCQCFLPTVFPCEERDTFSPASHSGLPVQTILPYDMPNRELGIGTYDILT